MKVHVQCHVLYYSSQLVTKCIEHDSYVLIYGKPAKSLFPRPIHVYMA